MKAHTLKGMIVFNIGYTLKHTNSVAYLMPYTIPLLASLIEESKTSEDKQPDEVLYRFVSSAYPSYEIEGYEAEAILLLVNFSIRRV